MYLKFFKRFIDIICSLSGIIILSPLLLFISAAVLFDSRGGIIFKQQRVGLHRKLFYIYKFRTMIAEAPHETSAETFTEPEKYITRTGAVLRATSLDELPQLFNILRGDMTIIGPRPALWNQFELTAMREAVGANDVKPGLTGLAQINCRFGKDDALKVSYDADYVKQITFAGDLQILLQTVGCVLHHKNIGDETHSESTQVESNRKTVNK